jgi:hypothetical protein
LSFNPGAQPTRYYVALGDSLSTGGGFAQGQGYSNDLLAFYRQAIPGLQLVSLGCPGETTTTMRNGGDACANYRGGAETQLAAAGAFLSSHRGSVALVTIDIGGDDLADAALPGPNNPCPTINFLTGTIVANCLSQLLGGTVQPNLDAILATLRQSAGAGVPIVGMNYFDPFLPVWLNGPSCSPPGLTETFDCQALADQTALATAGPGPGGAAFNPTLEQAYQSFAVPVADVQDAFATTDNQLVANPISGSTYATIPQNVANICAWQGENPCVGWGPSPPAQQRFTPPTDSNPTGMAIIAAAFERALSAAPVVVPTAANATANALAGQSPSASGASTPPPVALAFTGLGTEGLLAAGGTAIGAGLLVLAGGGRVSRRRRPARAKGPSPWAACASDNRHAHDEELRGIFRPPKA